VKPAATSWNSCIYEGWVRHRRFAPVRHEFRYRLFLMYLDLAELPRLFRGRWFWSETRPALARFRRADHLGDPDIPLDVAVRDLVEDRTGSRPAGPIRLLTHLRYWGVVFNPVSVYYCFDPTGQKVASVVLEVNNTPWGERHCYVLDGSKRSGPGPCFELDKVFHVSPFLAMDLRYRLALTPPGPGHVLHMECRRDAATVLDATLSLQRREITGRSLAGILWRHPFMTLKVVGGIYWQALKLWWKKCPLFTHPRSLTTSENTP
jgi:hypothetical protein